MYLLAFNLSRMNGKRFAWLLLGLGIALIHAQAFADSAAPAPSLTQAKLAVAADGGRISGWLYPLSAQ